MEKIGAEEGEVHARYEEEKVGGEGGEKREEEKRNTEKSRRKKKCERCTIIGKERLKRKRERDARI